MKKRCLLFAACFLFFGGLTVAHANIGLKFGLYASDKPSVLMKQFAPVLRALESMLSEQLGEPVKISFKFSKSYEAGIQDLTTGAVDFCRFGPASYVAAKKANPNISILALEANNGQKSFNGVICTRKESGIQTVGDLKGKSFAFGNELSTIGRYLAQQHLRENGIKESDLGGYEYLGSHMNVGVAVARGKFHAGALKEKTFKKLAKKSSGLTAIATFPNTTKPWIARAELPEPVRQALEDSLIGLKDPAVLKGLKKDGFLRGSDADYDAIRTSIENNELFFK